MNSLWPNISDVVVMLAILFEHTNIVIMSFNNVATWIWAHCVIQIYYQFSTKSNEAKKRRNINGWKRFSNAICGSIVTHTHTDTRAHTYCIYTIYMNMCIYSFVSCHGNGSSDNSRSSRNTRKQQKPNRMGGLFPNTCSFCTVYTQKYRGYIARAVHADSNAEYIQYLPNLLYGVILLFYYFIFYLFLVYNKQTNIWRRRDNYLKHFG